MSGEVGRFFVKRLVLGVVLAAMASVVTAVGPAEARQRNVAVLIFPGVQIIDYTGPWEVLGHATVDGQRAFRIYSVAAKAGPITTSMGMSVNPTYTFADAPKPDVLVVPGGGVDPQLENAALIEWVRSSAKNAEVVLSVCNGAFFLAKAGLLDDMRRAVSPFFGESATHQATTFASFTVAGSNVVSNVPFVLVARDWIASFADPRTMWYVLAMASTFAGNLTVVGSVANIIVLEQAKDAAPIGFFTYLRAGLPITLLTTALGTALLLAMRAAGLPM